MLDVVTQEHFEAEGKPSGSIAGISQTLRNREVDGVLVSACLLQIPLDQAKSLLTR